LSTQLGTSLIAPVKLAEIVPSAFVAEILNEKLPVPVGVPVTAPVEVFREIPAGRLPDVTAYTVGLDEIGDVAATPSLYGLPCKKSPRVWSIQTGGAEVVPENVPVVIVPSVFSASSEKLKDCLVVGVPVIAPVLLFKDIPAGSALVATA
jgi:hypothetical protein